MSKHKKTRKQKIIASLRHNTYSLENKDLVLSGNKASSNIPITTTYSYAYTFNDFFKTGALTLSIILIELILFFLLKNHIVNLPNINY